MKVYTGKSIDDIIQAASNELEIPIENISYNIIEEEKGFLGLGSKIHANVYTSSDIIEFLYGYVKTYFDNIDMNVEINVVDDKGFFHINLNGANNAILIGKNGQTLQAINTVLKSAVSAQFKRRVGVLVDINGYKEDKYHKVCGVAMRVAKTVQQTKTAALLDPMPADERKAIHAALTDMPHIGTVSEGEGLQRRLKIVYKD